MLRMKVLTTSNAQPLSKQCTAAILHMIEQALLKFLDRSMMTAQLNDRKAWYDTCNVQPSHSVLVLHQCPFCDSIGQRTVPFTLPDSHRESTQVARNPSLII